MFGLRGKPSDFPNPAVLLLTNAPGVTLRLSMLALPGKIRFELTDFHGLERQPAQAKYTDPGAASIVSSATSIDFCERRKSQCAYRHDGRNSGRNHDRERQGSFLHPARSRRIFVQVIQDAPAAGASQDNVQRVSLAYTMESAENTAKFYSAMMGIELSAPTPFSKDPALFRLYGAPAGTEFRKISGYYQGRPRRWSSRNSGASRVRSFIFVSATRASRDGDPG